MALESWDWFLQLAESGSITRASEELHISQQPLSSRLAALERELDTKLMVRSNPLTLTRSGETFLTFAKEQNEAYRQMLRQVGETSLGGSGVLKVGISSVRSRILMPHILDQFHQSLPGVTVTLGEGSNEELVHAVESNEMDAVIARLDGATADVDVHPLYWEEVVLVATPEVLGKALSMTPDAAVTYAQQEGLRVLGDCPFLLEPVNDISGRVAHGELRRAGIRWNPLIVSNDMMTLLRLAHDGLGAAFCPTLVLDELSAHATDLVRIPLSPGARYRISLGIPVGAPTWNALQVFEDITGALFADPAAQ